MEELNDLNEQLIKCQQELVGLLEAENEDLKRELTRMMLTDAFNDAKKKGD